MNLNYERLKTVTECKNPDIKNCRFQLNGVCQKVVSKKFLGHCEFTYKDSPILEISKRRNKLKKIMECLGVKNWTGGKQ